MVYPDEAHGEPAAICCPKPIGKLQHRKVNSQIFGRHVWPKGIACHALVAPDHEPKVAVWDVGAQELCEDGALGTHVRQQTLRFQHGPIIGAPIFGRQCESREYGPARS
eukprot:9469954-Pyramimonas_sp.AAC.1